MHVEVVHDHDLSRPEGRDQHLLNVGLEESAVDGPVDDDARANPVHRAGGKQREVGGVVAGRGAETALIVRRTTVAAGQRQIRAGLIEKDEPIGGAEGDEMVPDPALCIIPFTGTHRPFFRVNPARRMARLMVIELSFTL